MYFSFVPLYAPFFLFIFDIVYRLFSIVYFLYLMLFGSIVNSHANKS